MFKEILFIAILVFVAWVLFFQVCVPMYQGRPLFPAFRRKRLQLETELATERENQDLEKLSGQVDALKKKEV